MRNFSDTLDPVEQENTEFLRSNFPEYINFWEKHIGFKERQSETQMLEPYELVKITDGSDAAPKYKTAHERITIAHYGQFLNFVGVKQQLEVLDSILDSSDLNNVDKICKLLYPFYYAYLHMATILDQECAMWHFLSEIAFPGWTIPLSAQARVQKAVALLSKFGLNAFFSDCENTYKSVDAIRHCLTHWRYFPSKVVGSEIYIYVPIDPLRKADKPTTSELFTNGLQTVPRTRASEDYNNLLKFIKNLRGELCDKLIQTQKCLGLKYKNIEEKPLVECLDLSVVTEDRSPAPIKSESIYYMPSGIDLYGADLSGMPSHSIDETS